MILGIKFPDQWQKLGQWALDEMQLLYATITSYWDVEHDDQGRHSVIHASGEVFERGRSTALGEWLSLGYSSSLFYGSGNMNFAVSAGQFSHYRYTLIGTTMMVDVRISGGVTSGTAATQLNVALPSGFRAMAEHAGTFHYAQGAAVGGGRVAIGANDLSIALFKSDGSNWVIGTGVEIDLQFAFEIEDRRLAATGEAYAVDYLVVAGGGSGGNPPLGSGVLYGGGGGAGGQKSGTVTLTPGIGYVITIGAGGAVSAAGSSGNDGASSALDTISSCTGGGGGGNYAVNGRNGGSGGGGGAEVTIGGTGVAGQGNAGAGGAAPNVRGGGGGGSGAAGAAGEGGAGTASSISGAAVTYAVGGPNAASGTAAPATAGSGGKGGNGDGAVVATIGKDGTVIISYTGSQRGTGGTVTTSGGKTIHTFTASNVYRA